MDFPQWCYPLSQSCLVDWQAWGAIGTFGAVAVALYVSHRSNSLMERLRASDRQREAERDVATAARIALVVDHELYLLGGELQHLYDVFDGEHIDADPVQCAHLLHRNKPMTSLPLTSRFADQFGVFPVDAGSLLMIVLSQYLVLRDGPAPDDLHLAPREIQVEGVTSVRNTMRILIDVIRKARLAIRPFAARFQREFPDF